MLMTMKMLDTVIMKMFNVDHGMMLLCGGSDL